MRLRRERLCEAFGVRRSPHWRHTLSKKNSSLERSDSVSIWKMSTNAMYMRNCKPVPLSTSMTETTKRTAGFLLATLSFGSGGFGFAFGRRAGLFAGLYSPLCWRAAAITAMVAAHGMASTRARPVPSTRANMSSPRGRSLVAREIRRPPSLETEFCGFCVLCG